MASFQRLAGAEGIGRTGRLLSEMRSITAHRQSQRGATLDDFRDSIEIVQTRLDQVTPYTVVDEETDLPGPEGFLGQGEILPESLYYVPIEGLLGRDRAGQSTVRVPDFPLRLTPGEGFGKSRAVQGRPRLGSGALSSVP